MSLDQMLLRFPPRANTLWFDGILTQRNTTNPQSLELQLATIISSFLHKTILNNEVQTAREYDFKTQGKHHSEKKSWKVSSCQAPQTGEWRFITEWSLRLALGWSECGPAEPPNWRHCLASLLSHLTLKPLWLLSLCLGVNVRIPWDGE